MDWLAHVKDSLLALFVAHEFPVLFGLILIEEMGLPLPLPGDVLVAYAGGLHHSPRDAVAVIGTVTFATAFGSSLLYLLARRGGPAVVARLQRFLHLRPERIERTQEWFRRRGPVAIVVGRLIPGFRIPTSIMAGIAHVPYHVFVPSTMVAALIWSLFYYFVGDILSRLWLPFVRWASNEPEQVSGGAILAALLVGAVFWGRAVRRQSRRVRLPTAQ